LNVAKNKYLSDDHEDFTVSDRESIINILRGLARKNITLSGAFNGGTDILLSAVLGVDKDAGVAYLDINANEEFNQQFLKSRRVIFHALSDGAKVQWACDGIENSQFEGRRAFRISLPEKLQRIQRRSAFRVTTPISHPVICRIPVSPDREVALPLVDICVEGIGVVLPSPAEPAIQKNAEFRNCKLEHADLGIVVLTLSVQSVWNVTLKNGSISQHAGLGFVDISPRDQSIIQRFVYQMERHRVATAR
jgi:flagellar brake protein